MISIQNILVPVDFSKASLVAAEYAACQRAFSGSRPHRGGIFGKCPGVPYRKGKDPTFQSNPHEVEKFHRRK